MNVLVIANPVAGTGRAARRARELVRLLQARGHVVEWRLTTGRGDARRHASRLGAATQRIVVAGGDGTLNEVVNGLEDPSRTPLVPVAVGTANNLVRDLAIPRRLEALADLLEHGTIRRIDLGRIGEQRFLTLVSSGFDALVTEVVRHTRRGRLGYRGYLRAILTALATYRAPELTVSVDGADPVSGALVLVSNVRSYGGLFVVADRARCDSGHLDVCVFRRGSIPHLLRYALAAKLARVARLGTVEYLTGSRVRIESGAPVAVEVDGDYWGTTPVTISLEPAVVPFLVPASPTTPP